MRAERPLYKMQGLRHVAGTHQLIHSKCAVCAAISCTFPIYSSCWHQSHSLPESCAGRAVLRPAHLLAKVRMRQLLARKMLEKLQPVVSCITQNCPHRESIKGDRKKLQSNQKARVH